GGHWGIGGRICGGYVGGSRRHGFRFGVLARRNPREDGRVRRRAVDLVRTVPAGAVRCGEAEVDVVVVAVCRVDIPGLVDAGDDELVVVARGRVGIDVDRGVGKDAGAVG